MQPQINDRNAPPDLMSPEGMVWIPGGVFTMGSDAHYAEEAPAHRVRVDGFFMDRAPVTNRDFAEFVRQTGYVTVAELPPKAEDYPGALPGMLRQGSLVFTPPARMPQVNDAAQWWSYVFGADWRHPYGPDSTTAGDDHPVVQVCHTDARAYADWAGKALPTEAEWEFAARGGFDGCEFAWGDEFAPDGRAMANTWQGRFPVQNTAEDGWLRTSPVGFYPPNGYGLVDMIGNVWEWTDDYWSDRHAPVQSCCGARNPRGGPMEDSFDTRLPEIRIPRKVLKGGSHLCAPTYCRRYRPPARHAEPIDSAMTHIGFRCILRPGDRP